MCEEPPAVRAGGSEAHDSGSAFTPLEQAFEQ